MRKLLIIAVILVLGFFLNPKYEKHKQQVAQQYKESNPITGALGVGKLVSEFGLSYHNYYVFSTCTTPNDKTLTVGAFGLVFVTNSLDLNQALEKFDEKTK